MTGMQADIKHWKEIPSISRVRRNHALEHAPINLLSRQFPQSTVTSGLLAGLASFAALAGSKNWRDRLDRLPLALTGSLLAILVSQPLGTKAQQHLTTDADIGEMEIDQIIRKQRGGTTVHRVLTIN